MKIQYAICRDAEGIYVASVPALPGCATQADSVAEVERKIQDAISLYVGQMQKREIKVPEFIGMREVELG